jgi:hypothetical protein
MELTLLKTVRLLMYFAPIHDVRFFVITKDNFNGTEVFCNDTQSIIDSSFNADNPTRFLI